MKIIETNGITYLEKFDCCSEWYWGTNYTSGDLYEAEEIDEAEENVKMIFNEPIHDLSIENGEIIESGTNYAIINTTATTVLKGKKYDHATYSKSKYHTAKKHNQSDNINVIQNATLISSNNIDNILDLCYNYSNGVGAFLAG